MQLLNNIEDEWEQFMQSGEIGDGMASTAVEESSLQPTKLYISTKSLITHLNVPIDLSIFWNIPILPYSSFGTGIIKKQIKLKFTSAEEVLEMQSKLQREIYYDEQIISHIDNPSGRIKFKGERKISVGLSTKDIMSRKTKQKKAFDNCFVLLFRLKIENTFKEFHVKIFNTGEIEIPGILHKEIFEELLKEIIQNLQPFIKEKLECINPLGEIVLINSNFNCGFCINRDALFHILKNKYNIQTIYDPCSYPGVQCKFYYNTEVDVQTGCKTDVLYNKKDKTCKIKNITFVVFRTGSVIIVGRCDEPVIQTIYQFISSLLLREYATIVQNGVVLPKPPLKKKTMKKKIISVSDCSVSEKIFQ